MTHKMRTVTTFYDANGNIVSENERTAAVPGIEEIDRDGFRAAFHQLESTVLDTTDSTRQAAVSDFMKELSKKKLKQLASKKES